MLYLVSIWF
ncbi:UNVERIFIED_CONTAM: hypothetical protein GTU68_050506 [Idotea baltica]|nr:hypothetical protein [Idotea baltica]